MFQTRITRETKLSFQNNHNLNEENIFSYIGKQWGGSKKAKFNNSQNKCISLSLFIFHLKRRVRSVLEYNIFRDPIAWSTLGRGLSKLDKIYRLQFKAKTYHKQELIQAIVLGFWKMKPLPKGMKLAHK